MPKSTTDPRLNGFSILGWDGYPPRHCACCGDQYFFEDIEGRPCDLGHKLGEHFAHELCPECFPVALDGELDKAAHRGTEAVKCETCDGTGEKTCEWCNTPDSTFAEGLCEPCWDASGHIPRKGEASDTSWLATQELYR